MAPVKKVLLFVVEGPTDETALALLFDRIFKNEAVLFDIVGGDITTEESWHESPRERLRNRVKNYIDRQPYGWKDLAKIVQIVDTDGACIPDENVIESPDGALHYTEDAIEAPNVGSIRDRNARKRSALETLCHVRAITYAKTSVPYEVYYLSRNLEHALHRRGDNISSSGKEALARKFRKRFKDDIEGFKEFLRSEELAVPGDYAQTWEYIAQGTHSLERGSNLHLVLPDDPSR